MTSAGNRDVNSSATAVFPEAVGPKIASTKRPCMPRLWCLHPRRRADTSHMKVPRIFGGRTHMDRQPRELVAFIVLGAALSAAAVVGVSWAAGFGAVSDRFQHVDAGWLPLALAAEALAYVGYVLAYREVARVEDGPRLAHSRAPRLARPRRAVAGLDPRDPTALHQARAPRRADRNRHLLVRGHRVPGLLPASVRGPLCLGRAASDRLRDGLCAHAPDAPACGSRRRRSAAAVRSLVDRHAARSGGHRRPRLPDRHLLAADRAGRLRAPLARSGTL